jgi:hypothetical protein
MKEDSREIIELEVGGTHLITTTKATLTKFKNSVLAAMFNGKHEIQYHKGRVFIDWDGQAFSHVISYLWTGKIPAFENSIDDQKFKDEMHYYMIPLWEEEEDEEGKQGA